MNGEQKTNLPSFAIRHLIFWPILIGGIILDLWTKNAIFAWLVNVQGQGVTIIDGIFRLQLQRTPARHSG